MDLQKKAQYYARKVHEGTNHKYDGENYVSSHVTRVVVIAFDFLYLIPEDKHDIVIAACWAHDVIEDCRQTYNDVKEVLGEEVAEIVYALTNEKGKNRAERGNQKYYDGIFKTPFAPFVKVCDRTANMLHSFETKSSMAKMYIKEQPDFVSKINWDGITPMLRNMEEIITYYANL